LILHLKKLATALRLRWLCLEWVDGSKEWIGLGNPCNDNDNDCNIFAAYNVKEHMYPMFGFWLAILWTNGCIELDV
jgi:hypothetical protein